MVLVEMDSEETVVEAAARRENTVARARAAAASAKAIANNMKMMEAERIIRAKPRNTWTRREELFMRNRGGNRVRVPAAPVTKNNRARQWKKAIEEERGLESHPLTGPMGNTSFKGVGAAVRGGLRARAAARAPRGPSTSNANLSGAMASLNEAMSKFPTMQQMQRQASQRATRIRQASTRQAAEKWRGAAALAINQSKLKKIGEKEFLSNKSINAMRNINLEKATKMLLSVQPLNINTATKLNIRYRKIHPRQPNFANAKFIKELRRAIRNSSSVNMKTPPSRPTDTSIQKMLNQLATAITPAKALAVKRTMGWPKLRLAMSTAPAAIPAAIPKTLSNKQLAQILVDAFMKDIKPVATVKQEVKVRKPEEVIPEVVAEAQRAGVEPAKAVKFAFPTIDFSKILGGLFNGPGAAPPPKGGPSFWEKLIRAFEMGSVSLPRQETRQVTRQATRQVTRQVPRQVPSQTGTTISGPQITGPTVTVAAPNIKIQLNGLAKATEAARNDPSKLNALMRTVENLKAKLPSGSETVKVLETVYTPAAPLPTPSNIKNKLNVAVKKDIQVIKQRQEVRQSLKPKEPPTGRKFKNMSFGELISIRRKASNQNRKEINRYLMEDVESALRKIDRASSTERGWRLADLYKSLPENFEGRRRVLRAIQSEIRRTGRERDPLEATRRLRDLTNNLGGRNKIPTELRRELRIQEERALRNYKREERRRESVGRQGPVTQKRLAQPPKVALTQKRTQGPPLRQGGGAIIPSVKGPTIFAGPKALKQGTTIALPQLRPSGQPLLSEPQQRALTKVGGANQALKVIAGVPGGAPAVARAAADLNEMNGNIGRAQELRGTPLAAAQAVKKLGGAKNASYTLEALNTLAQKRPRSVKKRGKKAPIRLAELNKVIEAVKRQKLVSLVAHTVAKVKPSNLNNKKKKYYKRVIKSWILKRPFGNTVRQAARKNKS